MSRILELDFTRGLAVNLMVLSHLGVFFFITLKNMKSNNFFLKGSKSLEIFHTLGVLAHTVFIILVGVNMVNSYKNTEKKITDKLSKSNVKLSKSNVKLEYAKKNVKRALFIALLGGIMSILTFLIFGDWYIIFGIFQFIAVSILLTIPIQINYSHTLAGSLIIILLILKSIKFSKQKSINLMSIITGRLTQQNKFLDFFPVIPYFILILIGVFLGNLNLKAEFTNTAKNNKIVKEIGSMGRWSIQLYFLHIIIIFGIMKIILGKGKIKI